MGGASQDAPFQGQAQAQRPAGDGAVDDRRTAIVIAHRRWTVRALDRTLMSAGGRIVEDGMHDALLAAGHGQYRRLCERQAGTAVAEIA